MATRLEVSSAYKLRDTGPARLPALVPVQTGNPALDRELEKIRERLEVREGARGNSAERVVTQRELREINLVVEALKDDGKEPGIGNVKLELGGGLTATLAVKKFEDLIRATKLYQDLKRRLDDPTRFDDLPQAVREYVRRSLSSEAAERGTAITTVERIINERFTAMAVRVDTLTASLDEANSGVRETRWAVAEANFAQAGKITQLEASLGNFYQDGTPGRALLEEQMTATADRLAGLSAQYTLKVQAGGALAGFGLSATEVDGVPSSAFIIAANKFAIVDPATYNAGLTNTPDTASIPFGIDSGGIYLNSNVYVKGTMRVDAGGKTLADGLRGSLVVDNGSAAWSDTAARQAVWAKLGKTGTAPDNRHLVIGDQVRMGTTVRIWLGASWGTPGVTINGNMVVDGTLAARHIDTTGLTIRDFSGNVIFGGGTALNISNITGLGSMAVRNDVRIGAEVRFPDGSVMNTADFVNRLSRINASNISNYMETAAIGGAYIGNAAVGTLTIAGGAVTAMSRGSGGAASVGTLDVMLCGCWVEVPGGNTGVLVTASINGYPIDGNEGIGLTIKRGGIGLGYSGTSIREGWRTTALVHGIDSSPPAGSHYYYLSARSLGSRTFAIFQSNIDVVGGKR